MSDLVGKPDDQFTHVAAQIMLDIIVGIYVCVIYVNIKRIFLSRCFIQKYSFCLFHVYIDLWFLAQGIRNMHCSVWRYLC